MKALTPTLALTLAAVAPRLADSVPTPSDFGKLFCEASLAGDMSAIEAEMTPGLALVVAEAVAPNTQIQASFPDEKPPLGDGLPWRSFPDYADGCEIGDIGKADTGDRVTVDIRYAFSDYPDANYIDQLVLAPSVNEPGSWELDDINLVDGLTMRTYLAEAFDNPPTE